MNTGLASLNLASQERASCLSHPRGQAAQRGLEAGFRSHCPKAQAAPALSSLFLRDTRRISRGDDTKLLSMVTMNVEKLLSLLSPQVSPVSARRAEQTRRNLRLYRGSLSTRAVGSPGHVARGWREGWPGAHYSLTSTRSRSPRTEPREIMQRSVHRQGLLPSSGTQMCIPALSTHRGWSPSPCLYCWRSPLERGHHCPSYMGRVSAPSPAGASGPSPGHCGPLSRPTPAPQPAPGSLWVSLSFCPPEAFLCRPGQGQEWSPHPWVLGQAGAVVPGEATAGDGARHLPLQGRRGLPSAPAGDWLLWSLSPAPAPSPALPCSLLSPAARSRALARPWGWALPLPAHRH
uniref:calsenilin isoform X1 n=1 Tax=Ictidomys tridecemlineatus TaxID=43179 RepID=UPI001A9D40DD|nr:calsenilin isoform X1 [Ictidomys tridecemlineatus]